MVDPVYITNYNLDDIGLQEYILFCIAVAGKRAKTTATRLDAFLKSLHQESGVQGWKPFEAVSKFSPEELSSRLKSAGIGCHKLKGRGFHKIAKMGLDLKKCSLEDLERCPGIAHKTSRFFVLHTRRAARVACLDTHVLRWLKDLGYDVPQSSPQNKRKYESVEALFLKLAREKRMSPARLDLYIWRKYSGNEVEKDKRAA